MSFNLNRNSSLNENNHTYDSTSESNFDKSLRASPSINSGSEPPSYFEAVGIASHLNLVSNGVVNEVCLDIEQIQVNQNQYPPRIINEPTNKETARNLPLYPKYHRHHVIRTHNLSPNIQYPYNSSSNHHGSSRDHNGNKPSETYLIWSLFTTIYCFFVGIVALVFSVKVQKYNKEGDFQKAYSLSKLARNFNIAGLFFGVIYMMIGLLICFLPRGL